MDREDARLWSPSRVAAQRAAKRRPSFYLDLNLWPFVAVLLVLLIMFMVGGPQTHGDIALDLPNVFHATAQPKARAEDAMKIYVMRDGRVYFRSTKVQARSLPILIRSAVGEGAEKKIYLGVDAQAQYGDAAVVVEQVSKTGIGEICILAWKSEK
jgi:biopolymer transport protein ExbD